MLLKSTWLEFLKIAARPRSYIGFAAITVIVGIIQFAMYVDGNNYISFITQALDQSFNISGKILNGSLVGFVILQMLIIQVPLLVALVTGDLISGEAAMGTARLLLTRPISRSSVLLSKFLAGNLYIMLLLIWLGLLSIGLGLLLFGTGDLVVVKTESLVILQDGDITWRFFAAFGVAFLAMMLIGSLSLCLSCFSDNSIGPIITTMAIIVLFTIIGALEVPVLDALKPYMFTSHMVVWRNFFDDVPPKDLIWNSCLIMGAHIAGFMGIALYAYKRKDILS
ncbi:MAG TPA: ABC transporter permease subunit [Bacteroidia bacterium]|jgi:ABC-2 type transport system permease protein